MFVFLSHADEDSEIAREVADRLSSDDVTVYSSQGSEGNLIPAASEPDCAIQRADAFLALLSPYFLTSTSCRRERELALRREQCRHDNGTGDFIQVLKIRETPNHRAAVLHNRPWFDLTGEVARERVLTDLASKFGPPGPPPPRNGSPGPGNGQQPPGNGRPRRLSPEFRNRTRELEEISGALKDADGDHFWIVIAPPQLGKSWFLDKLASEFENRNVWVVKLVDARYLPAETLDDADAILRMMFGLAPDAPGARMRENIATAIARNNRVHLCLLDSAELLAGRTVRRLRQHLGDIDQRVARAAQGHPGYPRLMFVAASRRDDEWKGVSPKPRLRIRRLTEFKLDVIREVLDEMQLPLNDAERQGVAGRVHRLSEGLPALLVACLETVRELGWDVDMTGDQATFELIARPYIEQGLLSASSLRSRGSILADDQQAALKQAFLVTSLYRFLTVTHLSDHTERGDLPDTTNELRWTAERLWLALSDTDLLYRPEREPWYEIYASIRRLLFRHAYPSAADRIAAHRGACAFMQSFTRHLTGTDQCRAHAECLWHEAQALVLADAPNLEDALVGFARQMDANLTPTPAFDKATLRDMVARNITNDEEFADSLAHVPDLLDRLTEVVRQPSKE
jgi:TIR domain